MRTPFLLSLLLIVVVAVSACTTPAQVAPTQPAVEAEPTAVPATEVPPAAELLDIVDTAVGAGQFTTLVAAVKAAGLVETLKGEGPFTVLAPTDEAFAKLPAGTVEALLAEPEKLKEILLYHVIAAKAMSTDVAQLNSADTVFGQPVTITVDGDAIRINDALVTAADIEATNGVIHVIDTVLLPPAAPATELKDIVDTAIGAGQFKTLVAAVEAAGLVETLKGEGPFTVLAPSDEAFAKLPAGTVEALLAEPEKLKEILLYHVIAAKAMSTDVAQLNSADTVFGQPVTITVDGDSIRINDALVTAADIEALNGVIHVIDTVLLPPASPASELKDIVDTAVAAGQFKTLVAAVEAAGLVETLKGEGPFTVLAPTDEAFAKLPAGTIEALLAEPEKLKDILLYHVLSGKAMAADVVKMTAAGTALGKPITIKVDGDKVMINDALVTVTDIETSNGVIHVIDTVLLPPSE